MNMTTQEAINTLSEQRASEDQHVDWKIVQWLVKSDRISQRELSRETGISQGWMSRKLRHLEGVSLNDMDAHRAWLRRPKKARKEQVTL